MIKVRRYRVGDNIEIVRNIVNEAFMKSMMTMTCDDLERSYKPEWRDRIASDEHIDCEQLILATDDADEIVGVVILVPRDDDTAEISCLAVRPGCQGQGVGGALLDYVETCSRRTLVEVISWGNVWRMYMNNKRGYRLHMTLLTRNKIEILQTRKKGANNRFTGQGVQNREKAWTVPHVPRKRKRPRRLFRSHSCKGKV